MGGKKKTKWRKLPLEEFSTSKECSTQKKAPTSDYKLDIITEEEKQNPIPFYDDSNDINYPYNNEYREYADGAIYTSPYVIYNPVYPNYFMPEDPRCYYYYPSDMASVQEYNPTPYQEYVPPVKDTVYLLFPAPALRSHQGAPHASYDWRNRRRRRRFEGYAEYAVIDKNNSSGIEDRDQRKKPVFSGRNDNHYNHGRMTTSTETNSFTRDPIKKFPEPHQKNNSTFDEKRSGKRGMAKLGEEKTEDVLEKNMSSWKNNELCQVHTTKTTSDSNRLKNQGNSNALESEKSKRLLETNDPLKSKSNISSLDNSSELIESDKKFVPNEQSVLCKNFKDLNKDNKEKTLNNINEFTEVKLNAISDDAEGESKISHAEEIMTSHFDPLPDVVNNLQNNSSANKMKVLNEAPLKNNDATSDRGSLDGEKTVKSILSQSPYLHHPLNSDSFSSETEAELKKLRSLQSLKTDRSIYKLAYDENITDQSNSRSPSPIDPESQVPRSLPNSEILIHEADSGSEAGSEDVELISHRYESETSINENKHMYVNKLSLAVELLRTQENLPYDDQFKRVVGENTLALKEAQQDRIGEVNFAFVEDSYSMDDFDSSMVVTTQSEASRHFRNGKPLNEQSESCEVAKEMVESVNPVSREGVANRRFQVPFRHYFSPRDILVNPCSCCIIM